MGGNVNWNIPTGFLINFFAIIMPVFRRKCLGTSSAFRALSTKKGKHTSAVTRKEGAFQIIWISRTRVRKKNTFLSVQMKEALSENKVTFLFQKACFTCTTPIFIYNTFLFLQKVYFLFFWARSFLFRLSPFYRIYAHFTWTTPFYEEYIHFQWATPFSLEHMLYYLQNHKFFSTGPRLFLSINSHFYVGPRLVHLDHT